MAPKRLEDRMASAWKILAGRQFVGMFLNIGGMVALTHLLGPHDYGLYVVAASLAAFAGNLGRVGLDVFLIRISSEPDAKCVGVCQAIHLVISCALALFLYGFAPHLASWYREPGLADFFRMFAIVVPLGLLATVSKALLERRLDFGVVATIELAGMLAFLPISIGAVAITGSALGIMFGLLAQATLTLVAYSFRAKQALRPVWNRTEVYIRLKDGLAYTLSAWIWETKNLVNPLLVAKMLGPEMAAFVAMANKIVGAVTFVGPALYRVYMSYLSRLAHDPREMRLAIEKAMAENVLIVGMVLVAFLAVAPEAINLALGGKWQALHVILPFVAGANIVGTVLSLYTSALSIKGYNREVSMFHLAFVGIFAGSAAGLLYWFQDLRGYGWAEVAAFSTYFVIRRSLWRHLFRVAERGMFANVTGLLALIGALGFLAGGTLPVRLAIATGGLTLLIVASSTNRQSVQAGWQRLSRRSQN